jgi:cytochrome P450
MSTPRCPYSGKGEAAPLARTQAIPADLTQPAPLFHPRPIIGCLPELKRDPLAFLRDANKLGDIVRLPLMRYTALLLAHPHHIQDVMSRRFRNYNKQTRLFIRLQQVVGQGLLTSDGDLWHRQRRLAQPAFHSKHMTGFVETMCDCIQDALHDAEPFADSDEPMDMLDAMSHLTMRVVSRTLLSADITDETAIVAEALEFMVPYMMDTNNRLFSPDNWFPTARKRKFKRYLKDMDAVVMGFIQQRRNDTNPPPDLLSLLMAAQDEDDGQKMSDRQLRDEVMTMFLAGHETTAVAVSWAFYLISTHPVVGRRIQKELDDVLGCRAATFDDVSALTYTRQVLLETMRLYPPVFILGRRACEDDVIGGQAIRKGEVTMFSPWLTHRHRDFWPNPEAFDPDRFHPDLEKKHHPFAYLPFGGGPRRCIGQNFALMEGVLILAAFLQRFEVHLAPGYQPKLGIALTLRPVEGLPVHLIRRQDR